ncbi:MAG: hypothetical protein U0800_10520 [Isosphaeraceae bacterium]
MLPRPAILAALALAALATGCGGPSAPTPHSGGSASLNSALDAWKSGARCGPIEGQTPAVIAIDSTWQAGRKLSSYEVLGPVEGASPPRFRVKLATTPASAGGEVEYVLVGSDPVYVYRDADYERMIHMDNNPTARPKGR